MKFIAEQRSPEATLVYLKLMHTPSADQPQPESKPLRGVKVFEQEPGMSRQEIFPIQLLEISERQTFNNQKSLTFEFACVIRGLLFVDYDYKDLINNYYR